MFLLSLYPVTLECAMTSESTSLIWDVPVFEFFKTYSHGISPTLNLVGQINSMAEYDDLVPAPNTRVEMDRTTDKEEIRVVRDDNGDYHATTNPAIARQILELIDKHIRTL